MKIKWSPVVTFNHNDIVKYYFKSSEVLVINDKIELDFSDKEVINFNIPEDVKHLVQKADRINGEIYLTLEFCYMIYDRWTWEMPDQSGEHIGYKHISPLIGSTI